MGFRAFGGGVRIRTGVRGFAGPCLTARPRRQKRPSYSAQHQRPALVRFGPTSKEEICDVGNGRQHEKFNEEVKHREDESDDRKEGYEHHEYQDHYEYCPKSRHLNQSFAHSQRTHTLWASHPD